MPLTETFIRQLGPSDKTRRFTDGRGLVLEANRNGSMYWKLKHYRNRRSTTVSLGKWPGLSVRKARQAAEAFRAGLKARRGMTGRPFRELAEEWHEHALKGHVARERRRKRSLLDRYILPVIGSLRLPEISARLVLDEILRPVEKRGYGSTVRKVMYTVGAVFRYASVLGEGCPDPTTPLARALSPYVPVHRATVTSPMEIGRLMDDISGYRGTPSVEFALQLLPYVFVRPGELRGAEWGEIDLEGRMWRIPAERMKMKTPHLVPLSEQAARIINGLRAYTGGGRLLFPGRGGGRPISDAALSAALRYLGWPKERICPHGFRAMASTALNERGCNPDWIERQLAHQERSGSRAAYNHADWLPERARMMQEWADLLDSFLKDYRGARGL
jgi:integrase